MAMHETVNTEPSCSLRERLDLYALFSGLVPGLALDVDTLDDEEIIDLLTEASQMDVIIEEQIEDIFLIRRQLTSSRRYLAIVTVTLAVSLVANIALLGVFS